MFLLIIFYRDTQKKERVTSIY